MINFVCISPHAPLFLQNVGSKEDRLLAQKTIESLELLGERLNKVKPDYIVISSPHQDWGFNVPLYFLAKNFKGEVKEVLIDMGSPESYFKEGQNFYKSEIEDLKKKIALIASGDMSHVLKEDGPYGFDEEGPRYDADLIKYLKKKDIDKIFKLDDDYPQAGECGLRSFCFILGILDAAKINWQPEILSYEGPFGVGYLVADFKLK